MQKLVQMLMDNSGASAAEYAIILAIIGSAIGLAAIVLSGAIGNSMNNTTACINDRSSC